MNALILKRLVDECTSVKTDYELGVDSSVEVFNKEQFAELIVKECAHIVWLNSPENNKVHEIIKNHFGIE